LQLAGESGYPEELDTISLFESGITRIASGRGKKGEVLLDVLTSEDRSRSVTHSKEGETHVYDVAIAPPAVSDPDFVGFDNVKVSFVQSSFLPERLDLTYSNGRAVTFSYSDWVTVEGTQVPQKLEILRTGVETPLAVRVLDYRSAVEELDEATCYLTHYGLPEPEGVRSSSAFWGIAVSGLVLALIVFFGKRRVSQ
jgi:hypothetical protein